MPPWRAILSFVPGALGCLIANSILLLLTFSRHKLLDSRDTHLLQRVHDTACKLSRIGQSGAAGTRFHAPRQPGRLTARVSPIGTQGSDRIRIYRFHWRIQHGHQRFHCGAALLTRRRIDGGRLAYAVVLLVAKGALMQARQYHLLAFIFSGLVGRRDSWLISFFLLVIRRTLFEHQLSATASFSSTRE